MAGTTGTSGRTDPPVTGPGGELRVRRVHPHADAPDGADPLTVRLLFLLRTYPGLVPFQAADVAALDAEAKRELVARIDRALGLE